MASLILLATLATGATPAMAQSPDARRVVPAPAVTGSLPVAAAGSGHPLMQEDALMAAMAGFAECIESLWPTAARPGISRAGFERHTGSLTPDMRIMGLMEAQPEFTRTFWDYLETLVSETRIARGREMLARHRDTFAAVEQALGVDRHAIAAIWGIESNYGTSAG
jgi:membrane-bound lytic murein transglycosylase B